MKRLLKTALALVAAGGWLIMSGSAFAAFPDPYCVRSYSTVEPITKLDIDGISNPSSGTVGGTPANEDFTAIIGQLAPNGTYPVSVQGNTDGNFKSGIAVYIDWDQSGTFDTGEDYFLGILANSTGADGKSVSATITVPATAVSGQTRMRVAKQYGSAPTPATTLACGTGGFGQAEDYTVNIDVNAPVPPSLSMDFAPTNGLVGASSTLTLTLGNTSSNAYTLSADFTNTFPAGLDVAATPAASTTCTAGTVTTTANSVTLANGASIPVGGCTVKVDVSAATAGIYVNTIPAGAILGAPRASATYQATQAGVANYSTGFETPTYVVGNLASQGGWGRSGGTAADLQISTVNPGAGLQHLRSTWATASSGTVAAISGTQPVGTTDYSVASAKLAITVAGTGATWDFAAQDPGAGSVITRVRFLKDAGNKIQALDPSAPGADPVSGYVDTGAAWTGGGVYFDVKLIAKRSDNTYKICINGAQIYASTGFAGNIANIAIIGTKGTGTNGNTLDVDNVVINNTNWAGCDEEPLPVTYTVTPSVGTPSGTISPATAQTVNDGATTSFTLAADAGFHIDTVGGTCGGTLASNVFTTAAVTADCTVIANFAADVAGDPVAVVTPNPLTITATENATGTGLLNIANTGGSPLTYALSESAAGTLPIAAHSAQPVRTAAELLRMGSRSNRASTGVTSRPNPAPNAVVIDQGFDDITSLTDWLQVNNSNPAGTSSWFQGNDTVFPAFDGATTAYIGANFNNTAGAGTISNWLVSPSIAFQSGSSVSFYTRSEGANDGFADRLEVRLCTADPCTNVGTSATDTGDFGTLLLSINPDLLLGDDPTGVTGYPASNWAQFVINTGLPTSGNGRIAFRYFVTSGGPSGDNSDFMGIDRVVIDNGGVAATGCQNPSDIPWLSETPTAGTVAAASNEDVTVTADATGLAVGTYNANVCVTTNDPVNALIEVPVSLTVTASATPSLSKSFTPDSVLTDVNSVATVTLTNPTASPAVLTAPLNDMLPAGLTVVSATTSCGIILSRPQSPNASVGLPAGVAIPANGSCTLDIVVKAAAAGTYVNTLAAGALQTDQGNNVAAASATLTVAPATFTVTPSVGTPSGTISPATPQTVATGATISFTLTPDAGFHIDNVGGTCGGTLAGNVYTTSAASADCTVIANFAAGATFPAPYCAVTFPSSVEPITRVKFTGIDNVSSPAVGGSPALENFLSVTGGEVVAGLTYSMAVEGNTDGGFTTKVKAYIDWNQNGVFEANEAYVIGSIVNSTGTDGIQAVANIAVPPTAMGGTTRMRVIKKFGSTANPDPCNTTGYGQAEDYTLTVTAETGVPVASVSPTSFDFTVEQGSTGTDTMVIGNSGTATLTYNITRALAARQAGAAAAAYKAKAGFDPVIAANDAYKAAMSGEVAMPQALDLLTASNGFPPIVNVILASDPACATTVPGMIWHDHGGAPENGYGWNASAGAVTRIADKFTPTSYPGTFNTVCLSLLTNAGVTSAPVKIVVFADDGAGGSPGTQLGSVAVTANNIGTGLVESYQAFDISSMNLSIASGSVYIGVEWDATAITGMFLGSDEASATSAGGYSYTASSGAWDSIANGHAAYKAMYIRAVEGPAGPPGVGCDAPSNVSWLSVNPAAGTVSPMSSANVAVTVTPGVLPVGIYEGLICVNTNDLVTPRLEVPVTLEVIPAAPVDLIFKDGFDGSSGSANVVTGTINQAVAATGDGSSFNFALGSFHPYSGAITTDDINLYTLGLPAISVYWYGDAVPAAFSGLVGGVVTTPGGTDFRSLQSGDSIGPSSPVSAASQGADMSAFEAGGTSYIGVAFYNESTAALNFGYLHVTTSAGGFPIQVLDYGYDNSGAAITIP